MSSQYDSSLWNELMGPAGSAGGQKQKAANQNPTAARIQSEIDRIDMDIQTLDTNPSAYGRRPEIGKIPSAVRFERGVLQQKRSQLEQQLRGVTTERNTGFLSDVGSAVSSGVANIDKGLGYVTGNQEQQDKARLRQDIATAQMTERGKTVREKGVLGDDMSLGDRAYAAALGVAESTPELVGGAVAAAGLGALAPEAAAAAVGARVLAIAAKSPRIAKLFGIAAGTTGRQAAVQAGRQAINTALGTAIEGVQAGTSAGSDMQEQVRQQIQNNPEAFRNSEVGKELLAKFNGNFEAAANAAASDVGLSSAWSTGLATSLLAIPGSAFEARLLRGASTKGLIKEGLVGAAAEAIQEAPQSGAEKLISNLGMQSVGSDVGTFEGVAKAAGEGAIVGGLMGGGLGAAGAGAARLADGPETDTPARNNIATEQLGSAIDTIYAGRNQPQETALLESPTAEMDRNVGTIRVRGLNLTPTQIMESARQNESDPRIANILSQPVDATTKVQELARIYNGEEARRVEAGVVERVTPYLDGRTGTSGVRAKVVEELTKIGDEVVAESPVLSAIRDAVATGENGKPSQGGKQTLTSLRSIVSNYRPTAPQGQTIIARPQRGGDGSVLMTQDQLPNEIQREREADQAFRLADARQRRYEQGTATGEQREDLRPGAAEPQQQIFLNPAVYGEDMAGVEATIVAAETPGMIRIQYPSRSEVGQDGSPVIISEEVSPASLFDRVVRATPRMTQDFASDQRRPKSGVGTEMAGPRNSIDRTSSKSVTTQQQPGAVEPVQPEPNFQYTGTEPVQPVAEQQQELPAPQQRQLPAQEETTSEPAAIADNRTEREDAPAKDRVDTPQLPAPEQDNEQGGERQFSRREDTRTDSTRPSSQRNRVDNIRAGAPEGEREVVLRGSDQAEVAETEQEERTQEEVTSELDAAISIVNDALNRLKERGQLGRIAAVRIRSLMKTGSITAAQVKAAFKAADIASQIVKSNAKIDIQFVPNLIDPANGENVQGFFETYQKRDNMPLGGDGFYGVIKLSLSPEWANLMSETAAHEAFHPLQKLLKVADPKTYAALNRSFKANGTIDDIHPSLIRMFKRTIHPTVTVNGRKQTFWDVMKRDGLFWEGDEVGGNLRKWNGFDNTENSISELQAYVFGYYNDAVRSGAEIKSIANQFVKAYELFRQFTDSFGNWLRGNGFTDTTKIFRQAASGELAGRLAGTDIRTEADQLEFSRRKNNETGEFKKRIQPAKLSSDFYFAQPDVKQGENNVTTAAEKIQARTLSILGRPITAEGQQDELLAKTIAHEVKAELARSGKRNASGWYTDEMRKATQVAALIHPEIATDVAAKLHFTAALAITSQNQSVDNNSVYAERWYAHYKKTGKFPENEGWGKAASSIMSNAKLFNAIVERYGADTVYRFFATKFTVREMKAAGFNNVSGAADEVVYGSAILGPKIGAGFYSNLDGRYDPITIDMWFMRTWGRITGDLIGVDPELIAGQEERLSNALRQAGRPTNATGEALLEIARAESKAFEKDYKDNRADYDSKKKKKSEVALAAQRLLASYEDTKDAPKADWQRTWIRNVVAQAQQILQKDGINITNADLQAIIWYPEKRLWSKKFGVREKGKGADGADSAGETSYYDEFVRIAKSRGITDAQIQSAIQPSRGGGQGSGSVLGQTAVNQQAGGQSGTPNAFSAGEARRFIQDAVITRLNTEFPIFDGDGGRLARQESGHIVRKAGGNLARSVEGRVPVAATYSHNQKVKNALDVVGIDAPKFYELTKGPAAAKLYHRLISEAQGANKAGAAVYVYEQPEYSDMRLFLTEDGMSGFALKGDDIVSVFKHPNSQDRGVAVPLARLAVWAGGRRLDAFDTILPRLYSTAGFRVSTRMKWNDEYAPANWDKKEFAAFNNGEPDVVFMHYDPTRSDFYTPGEGEYVDDYDAAVEKQKADANGGVDEFTPSFTADIADTIGDRQYSRRTLPLERPPVDEDGTIVLDHFSVEPDITENDPSQWGRARTFLPREERQRMGKAPKRTYFGIATGEEGGYRKEFGPERTHYRAKIGANRLYDMANDPEDLKAKGRELRVDNGPMPFVYNEVRYDGVSLYEKLIEDAGYDGYWIKDPSIGLVAAVFKSLRLKKNDRQFSRRPQRNIGDDAPQIRRNAPKFKSGPAILGLDNFAEKYPKLTLWYERFVNRTRPIKQLIKNMDEFYNDQTNIDRAEQLMGSRAAYQTKDFHLEEWKPLLREIGMRGLTVQEVEEYLHNRHAEERNAVIRERNEDFPDGGSGIKDADARAYLKAIPADKLKRLQAVEAKVRQITDKTLQVMLDSGTESAQTVANLRNKYQHYVPLFREGIDGGHPLGTRGGSVEGSAVKAAIGSEKPVENILANILLQRERVIQRAEANRLGNTVLQAALQNQDQNLWIVIDPSKATLDEVKRQLAGIGMDPALAEDVYKAPLKNKYNKRTGMVQSTADTTFKRQPNVVATRVDGTDKFIVFNPDNKMAADIAAVLRNDDLPVLSGASGAFIEGIGRLTRIWSQLRTQYMPEFGPVNFTRDMWGVMLNLSNTPLDGKQLTVMGNSFKYAKKLTRVVLAADRGEVAPKGSEEVADLFDRFEKAGGRTAIRESFFKTHDRDPTALEKELTTAVKQLAAGKTSVPQVIIDSVTAWNDALENATRLAVFKAGIDDGLTDAQAAEIAKNISVNFNQRGQWTREINALYGFANASIASTDRNMKTMLGKSGKKIFVGGVGLGVIQGLVLAAAGYDEDDVPEWVKDHAFIIPIAGTDKYIPIPMPYFYNVFPALGRRMVEVARGDLSFGDFLLGSGKVVINSINPIAYGAGLIEFVSPSVADAFVQYWQNKDGLGRTIYNKDFNDLAPTTGMSRARGDTTVMYSMYSKVAEVINSITGGDQFEPGKLSPTPEEIKFFVDQAMPPMQFLYRSAATVEKGMRGEEIEANEIAFLRRFYGQTGGKTAEGNKFYENVKEINILKGRVKAMKEAGLDTSEIFANEPKAELIDEVSRNYRKVSELRKERRQLILEGKPAAEISAVNEEITVAMKKFNDRVKQVEGGQVEEEEE